MLRLRMTLAAQRVGIKWLDGHYDRLASSTGLQEDRQCRLRTLKISSHLAQLLSTVLRSSLYSLLKLIVTRPGGGDLPEYGVP
jgi:hypothetical protein